MKEQCHKLEQKPNSGESTLLHAETALVEYPTNAQAVLIADAIDAAHEAGDALAAANVQLTAQVTWEHALDWLEGHSWRDLVVVEARDVPEAQVETVLARCAARAAELDAAIVATVDEAHLDLAVMLGLGPHVQLLCRPSSADRLSATILAKMRLSRRPHESARDRDAARIHHLREDVTRIAETLARLRGEGQEAATPTALREPASGYRGPEDGPPEISAAEIRATIRARRMRNQFFPPDLFADPAWDMLLDLFAAALEGGRVSVSSLCIAAAVPPTTALRWIGALHEAGLFERQADLSDRRRAYIALSSSGMEGMRLYAAAVKRAGLALA